jgi:hypothetical protein
MSVADLATDRRLGRHGHQPDCERRRDEYEQ